MTAPTSGVDAFRVARENVLGRIGAACDRVGRDPTSVTLVAISKTVDAARVQDAVRAGLTRLGENRVQEGESKAPLVSGATWELVGPLQSNKVRRALETFDRIQTIDSIDLARRVDRLATEVHPGFRYPVLLQVNVDEDPSKAGFAPDAIEPAMPELAALAHLELGGLMTIGRLASSAEDARATFTGLRTLAEGLRGRWPSVGAELSMGMSDDFELAIEEGATIVRVGRALFGERPHVHVEGDGGHHH